MLLHLTLSFSPPRKLPHSSYLQNPVASILQKASHPTSKTPPKLSKLGGNSSFLKENSIAPSISSILAFPMASSSKGKRYKTYARKGAAPCPKEPEEQLPSTHISRFDSPSQYNDFIQSCANREIVVERIFDEQFLRSIDFPWLDRLIEWGWWKWIKVDDDVNPNLVKLFYFCGDNKRYDGEGNPRLGMEYDDCFKTTVLGKEIRVTAHLIRRYASRHMHDQGSILIPTAFPYPDLCKIIYNDPTIDYLEKRTGRMDLNTRILHLIVCQAIYPRGGDFATASKRDIYIMGKIIMNDPPNLAELVVKRMLEAVKYSKTPTNRVGLPYGKLVSKICRDLGGNLEGELVDNRGKMMTFGVQSVVNMGYEKELDGVWRKRGGGEQVQAAAAEGGEEEITMQTIMTELRGISTNMTNMARRMERIESRQQVISNQIFHNHANIQALRDNAEYHEPFPFYHTPPH